jgi:hypothetical protein
MEAAKLGNSIVVVTLSSSCERTERLLRGERNPLELSVGERKLQILDIGFWPISSNRNERRLWAGFDLRSDGSISVELAKAAIGEIRRDTGGERLVVELRPELWFKGSCGFPAFFPFEQRPEPPSVAAFSSTSYVSCMAPNVRGMRCFESKSSP